MKHLQEILAPLAERLGWAWLHSLWQGAAIAFVVGLLLSVLRGRSAATRHAVCLLGLFALAGAVVFTACSLHLLSNTNVRVAVTAATAPVHATATSPAPSAGAIPSRFTADDDALAEAPVFTPLSTGPSLAVRWSERLQPHLPWISALWLAGVALLSLRQVYGSWRIRIWRRTSADAAPEHTSLFARLAVRFAVSGKVWLRSSADIAAPILTGVLRPIILFPTRLLTGLSIQEVEAILAHEMAHLARRDTWSNLGQVLVEILFFYHPAIWWLGRRTRTEREHAADDLALRHCDSRREYAGALARLAELQSAPVLAVAASGGQLLARIRRIVRPSLHEPVTGVWSLPVLGAALALTAVVLFHAEAEEPKSLLVKAGESLQAAIDAAPPGAVLRLGEGDWKERVHITKPLTLEGAGWEKTSLSVTEPPRDEVQKAAQALEPKLKAATGEEKERLLVQWWQTVAQPAVFAQANGPVHLRGLRVKGFTDHGYNGTIASDTLVVFYRTSGSLTDCAITGPYENGVAIPDQASVEIRQSLVAGLWGAGLAVSGGGKLVLADSDIRNCNYCGIRIGRGSDSTVIERNWISGSAWHGIRYDNASPTITGNRIYGNARSGIYASGRTAAKVTGNLFWRNEMDGMSCWFNNEDTIEGNTFVGNLREGLAVLRTSKPTVKRNLFASQPVALVLEAAAQPMVTEALFWDNPAIIQQGADKRPAPEGSLSADPKFRNSAKADFALAADSPARAAKLGVAEPLAPQSRWPLLPEEKAIVPATDTRDFTKWTAPNALLPASENKTPAAESKATTTTVAATPPPVTAKAPEPAPVADSKAAAQTEAALRAVEQAASEKVAPWVAAAFQLDDKAKREAALERVRQALGSANSDEQRAGIFALRKLGPIEFDKVALRPLVRRALASDDVSTRAGAVGCLTITGADPEDLARVFELADDLASEVRDALPYTIMFLTKGDLREPRASVAILKLMDKLPRDPRMIAHALWGAKLSPELEARVLQYTQDVDSQLGYDFLYGTLSTQRNKSEAVCRRLIEILAHQDVTNRAGRAVMGLQSGVAREQYPLVASAMLRLLDARSDGYLRERALQNLSNYASAEQAEGIKTLLAKPGVDGEFRKSLEQTLSQVERK